MPPSARRALELLGFLGVVAAGVSPAADVGVAARKLIVIDRTVLASSAKVVFVATDRSAGITTGSGRDVADISARLDVRRADTGTGGGFRLPAGAFAGTDGWKVNSATVAKYVNGLAPGGPTGAKVAVIKPGKLLKLVGRSLGDEPIDVLHPGTPTAGMDTVLTVTNAGESIRHCSHFPVCTWKSIAAGTGAKLACKNGLPSPCPVTPTSTTTTTSSTSTTTTVPAFERITKAVPPTLLHVLPTTALSDGERVMVATLQGIVAEESGEQIYLHPMVGGYGTWLQDLETTWGVGRNDVTDPWALIAIFRSDVTGYLLYDAGDDSVNVATSLAGVERAIAVEASLESQAIAAGLPLVLDVRGLDEAWVVANHGHRLNPLAVVEQRETFAHQLRDYAVLSRALVFFDGNSPFRDAVIDALAPDAVAFGWGDATSGEDAFVGASSDRGVFTLPSDHAHDLAPLSGIPVQQQSQATHGAPPVEAGVHYASFLMTDGDNVQWLLGDFQSDARWFASPLRGTFDMGWGIPPSLAELAPSVMRWYYANAATGPGRDLFVAGPSGGGYLYPSRYPPGDLQPHVDRLAAWMALADLDVVQILDFDALEATNLWDVYTATPEIAGLVYLEYGDHAADQGALVWSNGEPVVTPRAKLWQGLPGSDEATVTGLINAGVRDPTSPLGYSLVVVHVWSQSLDDVQTVIDGLAPDVRVVTPGALVRLVTDTVPHDVLVGHDYTGGSFQTAALALVGSASWVSDPAPLFAPFPNRLRLTSNGGGQVGSAWLTQPIDPSRSWTTTFRFQVSFPVAGGADGIGFHVHGDGLGANPGHQGASFSAPSLSVVIDTWNNGPEGTDESLAVMVNGALVHLNDLLDLGPDPNPGSSETVFRMELAYAAAVHELSIRLVDEGGTDALVETVSVDLDGFGPSHAGFSAATGASAENHDVRTWRLAAAAP